MRIQSYLQSAQAILQLYKGDVPLAGWLKAYFKEHKKFGSKDRKHIAHLLYCYYRLGHSFANLPVEEKLGVALFLCSDSPNDLLEAYNSGWNAQAAIPPAEKFQILFAEGETLNLFPFNSLLSKEVDTALFNLHFLQQPPVYLRLRPGKGQKVKKTFLKEGVAFTVVNDNCIAVSSQTKVDEMLQLNADAVVQDLNSQRVLEVLNKETLKGNLNIWDCCAASGGKSILVWDTFQHVHLSVSDVRQSILHNLRSRFAQAGIQRYRSFVTDLSKPSTLKEKFDLVICDAPCSGSGTWGRTPEQLLFFTAEKVAHYTALQKSIVTNVAKNLKAGGQLLYITCSVFKAENEDVVDFIQATLPLKLQQATYFTGYDKKADTLFAASFVAL